MLKRIAILIFILGLLLAACQGAATPSAGQPALGVTAVEPTQELAAVTEAATVPAVQETRVSETQAGPKTAAPVQSSGAATCTTVSRQPTPGPTEQSLFPPAGEGDWIEGGEAAAVTIFEYSDFQ